MHADEFRDYCLGFIFYKYLSERLHTWANKISKDEGLSFTPPKEVSTVLAKIVTTGKAN